ncbi:MAG: hypothetical protein HY815_07245 [Candidatus Riflebacteria bacterium]|nr:hypothetical protein [Candidatus Riflebacteria bacterium]
MLGFLSILVGVALLSVVTYVLARTVFLRSAESRAYKRGLAQAESGDHNAALREFLQADASCGFTVARASPSTLVSDLRRLSCILAQVAKEAQRLGTKLDLSTSKQAIDRQIAILSGKANVALVAGKLRSEMEPEVNRLNLQLYHSRAALRAKCGALLAASARKP